jgi:hypothetical protein
MKRTVMQLEAPNEPSTFEFPIQGNYVLDSFYGELQA